MLSSPTEQRLRQLLPELFQSPPQRRDRYLRFYLTPEWEAAVSLDDVREAALFSSEAIVAIPNQPSWMLGWASASDRAFGVVALAEWLGLVPTASVIPRHYPTIVVQTARTRVDPQTRSDSQAVFLLGLAVERLRGTIAIAREEVVSPVGEFPSELTPYLCGCLLQGGDRLAILDLAEIAAASSWK